MATADGRAGVVTADQIRLLRDGRETTRGTVWACRLIAVFIALFGIFGVVYYTLTGAFMLGDGLSFAVTNGAGVGVLAAADVIVTGVEAYVINVIRSPGGAIGRLLVAVALYWGLLYLASNPVED